MESGGRRSFIAEESGEFWSENSAKVAQLYASRREDYFFSQQFEST
jgi:hypothetical protein